MVLPLDLRQKLMDVVQIPSGLQPQFMGAGLIESSLRGFLDGMKTGSNRLIDHPPERSVQPLRNRSSSVQNIVIDGECGSHDGIVASHTMMSRHHLADNVASLTRRGQQRRQEKSVVPWLYRISRIVEIALPMAARSSDVMASSFDLSRCLATARIWSTTATAGCP